jgi:hypothetical protein
VWAGAVLGGSGAASKMLFVAMTRIPSRGLDQAARWGFVHGRTSAARRVGARPPPPRTSLALRISADI